MTRYIHIDSKNMFYRAAHTVNQSIGVDAMAGMAVHTLFSSMAKVWKMFSSDQVIFHMDGKPWRNAIYPKYKYNRILSKLSKTEEEQETNKILFDAYEDLCQFMIDKTNVPVMKGEIAEADDMIAIFIQMHPNDEHVIISSDSDFIQLLKHDNVTLYNGVTDYTYRKSGVTDGDGRIREITVKSDGKVKIGDVNKSFIPEPDWYEYAMFIKYIRGDKSDNIFSCYPGVRIKGTKNKVGILEAYEDRFTKGFKWNNFMLTTWTDEEDNQVKVKDRFELNRQLIDLERQPEEIVEYCSAIITQEMHKERIKNVGFHFMKFCGIWDLQKLSDRAKDIAAILDARVNNEYTKA